MPKQTRAQYPYPLYVATAIITTFHEPTKRLPLRTTARDSSGNEATVLWDGELPVGNHREAAKALCAKMHWSGTLCEGILPDDSHVFVWVEPGTKVRVHNG